MSSPNYHHLAHLKIPLQSILSATDNFSKRSRIQLADIGNVYKGQLLWSGELIEISARRLNKERDDEIEQHFWMEISLLSSLKHKNLVSLVGFCDDNDEKIIITKYDGTRGMLFEYLSYPRTLTWVRRLGICVGLANVLSYIHYDELRDFSVIHRNIDSETILLNNNWEPKLSEFRLSMKVTASERNLSFDTGNVSNMLGYTDPAYIETKSAHHKSDMYSFGIVMLELMCGKKAVIDKDGDKQYLAPLAISHYREKKLNEIIDWDIWSQMDSQSFNIVAEIAYECLNEERSQRPKIDEIVTRLKKALELQLERRNVIMSSPRDDLAHLKIPFESIASATNNFDVEDLSTGRFGKCYKGQLLWSGELINIIAERINKIWESSFWTEVSMLASLKHKNVVSLVGFCDRENEYIIITKYDETRGMLSQYLSDPMLLTWVQRLKISVGLAHALSYIHHDGSHDFSVIHRLINSSTVLLNDDWEPKLSKFEHSMKIEASQRHHSFLTNTPAYVKGYVDPTYFETKSVNHKSDIYSFGIVLFELLCGRESIIYDQDNKYLAPTAIFHYKKKLLHDLIDPVLLKQMDPESFNVFAETAYDCLNEDRSQRPNIDNIITRLENALELQLERENVEHSVAAAKVKGTSFNHEKGSATIASIGNESQVSKNTKSFPKDLSHLNLTAEDLRSATNNFDEENINKDAMTFKGRLLRSEQFIDIFGKIYQCDSRKDESKKFRVELLML